MEELNQEKTEETPIEESYEDYQQGGAKQWLQDNLRIIISILIVVLIAGGIYSYSRRTDAPSAIDIAEQNDILDQIAGVEDNNSAEVSANNQEEKEETKKEETKTEVKNQVSSTATSQETEKSFIESAVKGDSKTKLARRALANYLEKNPDSSLSPEHKIYIEDYLRKHVSASDKVNIGTSMEFSKDMIKEAISKSKELNSNQLQNLHKYTVQVPSLS